MSLRNAFLQLLAAAGAVSLALAAWAFWLEPASLRLSEYRLEIPHWPNECNGTRVALLADLHVGSPWNGLDKLDQVVAMIRGAKPDLILLAGDFVIHGVRGGTFVPPVEIAERLESLDAPLGVFAVLGNHDWWYDAVVTRDALRAHRIVVLEEESRLIEGRSCRFWLAGVGDYWEGGHDVARTLARVPRDAAILAVTHNPDVFPDVPPRVALTLAGHTHGGQVYLPLIGRPIVPSKYGERYAIGHVVEQGRHLFVTPGVGTSIIPVRFLVPPEISLLTLDGPSTQTMLLLPRR